MTKGELKYMVLGSIISADNTEFTEEVKQEIITRYNKNPEDLAYVLEPIEDYEKRLKYLNLLTL